MGNLLLGVGDIITMEHNGDKNEHLKHPFLIIESNKKFFLALQITSVKYDNGGYPISSNKFTDEVFSKQNFIVVDENNGLKYVSLILLEYVYKVKFGNNKYDINKVSQFKDTDDVTLDYIVENFADVNNYENIDSLFY